MNFQKAKRGIHASLFFIFITILLILFHYLKLPSIVKALFEATVVIIIFIYLLTCDAFRKFILGLPLFYKIFISSFLLLLLSVQSFEPQFGQTTFPFVTWKMYDTILPQDHVIFYQYVGVFEDGHREALVFKTFARKTAWITRIGCVWRINRLKSFTDQKITQEKIREIDDIILRTFKTYRIEHPEPLLKVVELYKTVVDLKDSDRLNAPHIRYEKIWGTRYSNDKDGGS